MAEGFISYRGFKNYISNLKNFTDNCDWLSNAWSRDFFNKYIDLSEYLIGDYSSDLICWYVIENEFGKNSLKFTISHDEIDKRLTYTVSNDKTFYKILKMITVKPKFTSTDSEDTKHDTIF